MVYKREKRRERERLGVLRCSLQTPLCRNVPLFSHSYDATKFKRGILAIRRAIHCARNNPVAKTLRFTRRRLLLASRWYGIYISCAVVRGFDVSSAPINPRIQLAAIVSSIRRATCFMRLFLADDRRNRSRRRVPRGFSERTIRSLFLSLILCSRVFANWLVSAICLSNDHTTRAAFSPSIFSRAKLRRRPIANSRNPRRLVFPRARISVSFYFFEANDIIRM